MQCSTDQRLQELQALGYGSESDYQAHSTLMEYLQSMGIAEPGATMSVQG